MSRCIPQPGRVIAQYLIAASHYDQIPDTSRDAGPHRESDRIVEEVVRKYPTLEYADTAKAKWKARGTS